MLRIHEDTCILGTSLTSISPLYFLFRCACDRLQSLLSSRLRGHSVLEIVEENPQFFALLNNGQTVQMVEEPQQKGKKEDKKSENNPNKVERGMLLLSLYYYYCCCCRCFCYHVQDCVSSVALI